MYISGASPRYPCSPFRIKLQHCTKLLSHLRHPTTPRYPTPPKASSRSSRPSAQTNTAYPPHQAPTLHFHQTTPHPSLKITTISSARTTQEPRHEKNRCLSEAEYAKAQMSVAVEILDRMATRSSDALISKGEPGTGSSGMREPHSVLNGCGRIQKS